MVESASRSPPRTRRAPAASFNLLRHFSHIFHRSRARLPRTHALHPRSNLDVDVALNEVLHFLTNDERLPGRTRKTVQFLNGLREQMVLSETHKAHPELFECPLARKVHPGEASQADTREALYTFKEVRQGYGESFSEHFWPLFGAFNTLLPAHAPEDDEGDDEAGTDGLSAFLPPASKK